MPRFPEFFKPSSGRGPNRHKSSHNLRLAFARRRAAKSGGLLLLLALLVSVISLPPASRAQFQSPAGPNVGQKRAPVEFVPGEVIVRFRSEQAAELSENDPAAELPVGRGRVPILTERFAGSEIVKGLRVVRVPEEETLEAVQALKARADVLYAEPNYVRHKLATPTDPRFKEMWGLKNTGQPGTSGGNPGTVGADIDAEAAWNLTKGSRSVVVGVVDEGIDINHPDLAANIWKNPGEVAGNGVDDDGNGFVDDVNGWDFFHNDKTVFDNSGASTDDTDAHGTHVAGTIGAVGNNSVGVVGVNWQVSIMSLKILGVDGEAPAPSSVRLTVQAYNYAKKMRDLWASSGGTKGANLRVLNNSYGGGGFSQAELDAINALNTSGILFVAAAGNDGYSNDILPSYPASYNAPNVISVAASNNSDLKAYFTNFGARTVHMAAPGEWILSTTPNGTYSFYSGTSMASPHVAGAAALVVAANPNVTVKRLRAALMYSGDVMSSQNFYQQLVSGRRLNALKALQSAAENDTTAPGSVGNFRAGSPARRKFTLNWTAPGDDASTGTAALYEIRFTDTQPTTAAQFEQGTQLVAPLPAVAGTAQSADVEVPFRHPTGFISIRALDNAGNAGPITSAPVTVQASDSDPYVVTEVAAQPLSTGGTPLALNGDDSYHDNYALPFAFPYFEGSISSVSVSTNGALYLSRSPSNIDGSINDAGSSVVGLNSFKMIAGIWDDLRTDRRAGDDVYVVKPDANRVIFRWQAVTFDTPYSATSTRGENPVSFEIELNKNGVITLRYGAGNQKLWPVVGISGGAPDAYPVASHTSESAFKSLANAQTVVFTPRQPVAPTVSISSLTVTPSSIVAGKTATGKVTLSAPAPAGGVVVNLSDDLPSTTMPASITIAAGTTSKTFTITTASVVSAATGQVRAASGVSVATAPLTVQPLAPASLVLSPATVPGGNNVTGTVTLNGPAPSGGAVVALSDDLAATTVPASVTVAAGSNKATFAIKTAVVTVKQTGTATASMNGVSKTAALTVRPIGVLSVSLTPNPITGGNGMTGTVVLEHAAPAGGIVVALKDTLTSATTPASVTVAAGATSKTFTVTTTAVTATQKGTLTATANAVAKSVVFTINP
jgi:subtilisin family serine protease